ncbi:PREDICTED: uncharacterized protein LOC106308599 [Brassica oleracea var. oleracea]|uniref:uncharacterized protein LOC106308599 n=1 Tax=Brassica oleracea var. oleracea TaxID=109376 RepID=UPI0006A71B22|nr:PREDICTED: uncharacterized protein LOC106308599 [Brassica oleracea var. oleracea]
MEGIDDHDSDDADTEEEDTTPEITLNALTGWDSPTTMRLLAIISNHDLHALVDCGSTHNYVSEKMVIELKLQETPTKPFDIHVANDLVLVFNGYKFSGPYSQTGKPKLCNWIWKTTPHGLPPVRDIEHTITLKEGTDPINVHPYRYTYFQKDEIERKVAEMLNAGIIQSRSSPFSSHVLLVKKKDGSGGSHERHLSPSHEEVFVLVFFDDILIYSLTWEANLQHVREVLRLIQQHKLSVKLKKCEFGKRELEYLGNIISNTSVTVVQSKVRAMTDWPFPTTITELCCFLGLTGYYRKFVRDYGLIARPLTNLLRKGKFLWSSEADADFNNLKREMTTTPTLALPDFSKPFVIKTDASGEGIGAVLSQAGQQIAFMSRSLGVTKKAWSTYAREMLAILVYV